MRKYYVIKQNETPDRIMSKGVKQQGIVVAVKRSSSRSFCTTVSCDDRLYSQISRMKPSCTVGSSVDVYRMKSNADGEYYLSLAYEV